MFNIKDLKYISESIVVSALEPRFSPKVRFHLEKAPSTWDLWLYPVSLAHMLLASSSPPKRRIKFTYSRLDYAPVKGLAPLRGGVSKSFWCSAARSYKSWVSAMPSISNLLFLLLPRSRTSLTCLRSWVCSLVALAKIISFVLRRSSGFVTRGCSPFSYSIGREPKN